MDIRRADGLVQRWEVRRRAEKASCVVEAVPGGTTPAAWASRLRDAMALDTTDAKEVPPEVLIGTADGSLAAQKLLSVLRDLGDAQPGFWTAPDRLPKAAAELTQAYAETRVSMQDGVPYALEALVLDLRLPFEGLGADQAPRRAGRGNPRADAQAGVGGDGEGPGGRTRNRQGGDRRRGEQADLGTEAITPPHSSRPAWSPSSPASPTFASSALAAAISGPGSATVSAQARVERPRSVAGFGPLSIE